MFSNWTEKEVNFLRENYPGLSHKEIAQKLERSSGSVKAKALKLGLRANYFRWTPESSEELRLLYPKMQSKILAEKFGCSIKTVHQKAFAMSIKKNAEFLSSEASGRIQKYSEKGKAGRFKKGHIPYNKGTHPPTVGRMAETQFKKNQMPHNHLQIGVLRKPGGYWKIKIAEPNVWEFLHIKTWTDANGEIPDAMCIVFKDKNQDNCTLENLECVTRKELYRRNSIHNFPDELKQTIQTLGRLKRTINRSIKNAEKQNI